MAGLDEVLSSCPLGTAPSAQRVLEQLLAFEPRSLWSQLGAAVMEPESIKKATVPILCACLLFSRLSLEKGVQSDEADAQAFMTQMLHIIPHADWTDQAPLIPDVVSELFKRISSSPVIPDRSKRALVSASLTAIHPSGLTCLHTALPGTPLTLEQLESTFDKRFPPTSRKDIFRYFLKGAQLFESYQSWTEASTYAALALTVYDTAIKQKLLTNEEDGDYVRDPATEFNDKEIEKVSFCHSLHMLYEVLAYGHYTPLTLIPYTNALILKPPFSSVVRDMTRIFNEPLNAKGNGALRDLVSSHSDLLKTWHLWHLSERIVLKYRIQWLHSLHLLAPRLLWADLIDTGAEPLDSLLAADYRVDIQQHNGSVVVARKSQQTDEKLAVLQRVSRLCNKIESIN